MKNSMFFHKNITTEVKLAKAQMVKLEKNKQYLLIFPKESIYLDDAILLSKKIKKELGIKGLIVLVNGDPKKIKVVEE